MPIMHELLPYSQLLSEYNLNLDTKLSLMQSYLYRKMPIQLEEMISSIQKNQSISKL